MSDRYPTCVPIALCADRHQNLRMPIMRFMTLLLIFGLAGASLAVPVAAFGIARSGAISTAAN